MKHRIDKVERSGYVYRLYRENILHLWLITVIICLALVAMVLSSGHDLLNYVVYRRAPDEAQLTEFLSKDILDYDTVLADIQENSGGMPIDRTPTTMFYEGNVYHEGGRYRFSMDISWDNMRDTGIYYDERGVAYTGITDRAQLGDLVPREDYPKEHLYLYEYNGLTLLVPVSYNMELDGQLKDRMRVTFAPIGIYSVYMIPDLYAAGIREPVCNFMMDLRNTPVDFEDEDFKDFCMFSPFALAFLLASILLSVFPALHPTYRQLQKYGRTVQKAAEKVNANYEEFGVEAREKNIYFLNDWLVKKSFFKNSIEKNYKKQPN